MSYRSSFDQLYYVDTAGDAMPSTGAFALLSLAQLGEFEAKRVPGDCDAHVSSYQVDRASCLVVCALTNFCPPPVVNDVAPTVTAPVTSGQGVGSLVQRSARISGSGAGLVVALIATVVSQLATSPDSLIPSRMAALSTMYASQHVTSSDITPIAAENKNARPTASLNAASMVSPVVVPSIIRTAPRLKKSNLDLNGRLVKKGLLVSWHGYRFHVSKVRMGTCYPVFSPVERRFFDCESVQVVG